MLAFLLRSLWHRGPSLALTILGLALAYAATLAVFNLHGALHGGRPKGADFSGQPSSIFMHDSSNGMDFFLAPRQIMALQAQVGESGHVIASSGAREVQVQLAQSPLQAAVDVVSPGFFSALGVTIRGGDARRFADPDQAPTGVVSERFLKRLGLQGPPESLEIAGHTLQVLGVAAQFDGLWDHETEIWLDWRLAHDILFPGIQRGSVQEQPWFYWTLAIPAPRQDSEFSARLTRALEGGALAEAPFDRFQVLPGISNQLELRRAADTSVLLYLALCVLMLIVACANLAAWSALMRLGHIEKERTFLQLGIPRFTHALLGLGVVLVPSLLAVMLAVPLEQALTLLLRQDSAIYALLAWSAEYERNYPWLSWMGVVGVVSVFGWLLGLAVARRAGLYGDSLQLRSPDGRAEKLFRPLIASTAMLAAMALLFGLIQSATAYRVWRSLAQPEAENIWILKVDTHAERAAALPGPQARRSMLAAIAQDIPQARALGFIKTRPFSSAREALSGYSLEPGQPAVFHALLNEADAQALPALGAHLQKGRHYQPGLDTLELVLDSHAADTLAAIVGHENVLGTLLYDASSMPWEVVGIVDAIAYSAEPGKNPPVAYMTLMEAPAVLHLVINSPAAASQITALAERPLQGDRVHFDAPLNLAAASDRAFAQYRSRALLGVICAVVTVGIAALTVLAVVTLEIRRQRRRLAIRASLGERPWRTALHGGRKLALTLWVGTVLGLLGIALGSSWLAGHALLQPADFIWAMPLTASVMMALAAVGIGFVLLREFFATPLARHLREE